MTTIADDYDENFDDLDEFDDDERGVSGFVVLLIILAMLLAFSFIVWLAYNKGIRQGASTRDVPYVAADPEPVKRAAVDASTANATPNREVYDRIDGRNGTRTEVLGSGPEEPIVAQTGDTIAALAAQAAGDAGDRVGDAAKVVGNAASNAAANTGRAAEDAVRAGADTAVRYESAQSEKLTSVIRDAVEASDPTPPVPSAARNTSRGTTPVTNASTTSPSTSSSSTAASTQSRTNLGADDGTHVVQVGAFRSEAEADQFWNRLNNRFGTYLDGKGKDIERADLGAKGIYYRLRIAGFDDGDTAKSYCEGLKARSQDCLVKKR